ncbi:cyclic nucleotide-binding domain-containing protein [Microbaculum marinum]|uniref:Cyclic nucleotide-binding domain-containing protein n=1 Tax=Microbaculum marinum TaxID=1764581 RepID=A0AAW9RS33_9HYPH
MSTGEIAGYLASALVFVTFYMKTMLPLRIVAIASNVAFITYALFEGLTPILILHATLLPLNSIRLAQILAFMRKVENAASSSFSMEPIFPLMQRRVFLADETIFNIGDRSDELYYVLEGRIWLPQIQREIAAGDFLGELAVFSETQRRTASAIARTNGVLMVLKRQAVFSALLQNPALGVHLLKLITLRMLENMGALDPLYADEGLAEEQPDGAALAKERRLRRAGIAAAFLFSIVATVVAIGPLIYSIATRNAALTTWMNVATAPIDGTIEHMALKPGDTVDASGKVADLTNHLIEPDEVIRARAQFSEAQANLQELDTHETRLLTLLEDWNQRTERYADAFRENLDLQIDSLTRRIELLEQRVEYARSSADRMRTLRSTGATTTREAEAAESELRDREALLAEWKTQLDEVRLRRRMASEGIYLQADGKEPEWSWRSRDELRLEIERTKQHKANAVAALQRASEDLSAANIAYEHNARAAVTVPAGARIWSSSMRDGVTFKVGGPLFSWIDCSKLLVDVPTNDLFATLAEPGQRALVILEGEDRLRDATILMSRAAPAKLGQSDLAVVARGHGRGTAQLILSLDASDLTATCPIGRAARVEFPDIGVLDLVRAYFSGL